MTSLTKTRRKPRRTRAAGRRRARGDLTLATVAFAGLLILLYPSLAGWVSALQQHGAIDRYVERTTELPPGVVDDTLQAAHDYNDALTSGLIIDPFSNLSGADAELDDDALAYLRALDSGEGQPMARLQIPTIGVDLPVYHGATEDTLRKGVGHLYGSSLPVGGRGTHTVLTGHSGLPESRLLTDISRLEVGDTVTITVLGQVMLYRVAMIEVVAPTEIEQLHVVDGKDLLSLVTCTPIGINTDRLIVQAERMPDPAESPPDESTTLPVPWWAAALVPATVGWILIGVRSVRSHRR